MAERKGERKEGPYPVVLQSTHKDQLKAPSAPQHIFFEVQAIPLHWFELMGNIADGHIRALLQRRELDGGECNGDLSQARQSVRFIARGNRSSAALASSTARRK